MSLPHTHTLQVEKDDDAEPFFLELARKIPFCGVGIADSLNPDA